MRYTRRQFVKTGSIAAGALALSPAAIDGMNRETEALSDDLKIAPSKTSSASDFDFLIGKWKTRNRKLKSPLSNSDEWAEFEAAIETEKILNGLGQSESFKANTDGKPYEALTLRLFDPKTRLWTIHWVDGKTGVLQKNPVVGSFDGDLGKFYSKDVYGTKEVRVLYQWDKKDPERPVCSFAFSVDNGKTWEWNWHINAMRQTGLFEYAKYSELPVFDQARALKFYTEKIGLSVIVDRPYGKDRRWIELAIPGAETRIFFAKRPDETPRDEPGLFLVTRDVKKSYETLKARGVNFTQGPKEAYWGPGHSFALFRDSENNTILIGST